MKFVGAHVPTSGGVENAPINAAAIGAKAFALFTRNQRRWVSKPLSEKNINKFKENCKKYGYLPKQILPHDSYLINLGHPDNEQLKKSRKAFLDETIRCKQLGLKYLNFHPGSTLGKIKKEDCIKRISESLNITHQKCKEVIFVIENTAGQGNNLGYRFEQIAKIIDLVEDKKYVGVCLDTCHTFASGYDIKSSIGYKETMEKFGKIIGFKYLNGMHLNDSKKNFGTRVDRHHNIGLGFIGEKLFKRIMNDSRLNGIPLILETPDDNLWEKEIKLLYSFVK